MEIVKGCLAMAVVALLASSAMAETKKTIKNTHPAKPTISIKTVKHALAQKKAAKHDSHDIKTLVQAKPVTLAAVTQTATNSVLKPATKSLTKKAVYESDGPAVVASKLHDPEADAPPITPGHQILAGGDPKEHDFYIVEPENVEKVKKMIASSQKAALDKFYAEHPKMLLEVEAPKTQDVSKLIQEKRKLVTIKQEDPILSAAAKEAIPTPPEKAALPTAAIVKENNNVMTAESDDDDDSDDGVNPPLQQSENEDKTPNHLVAIQQAIAKSHVPDVSVLTKHAAPSQAAAQPIPVAIEKALKQSANKTKMNSLVAEATSFQHEGNLLASEEDGPSLETVLKQAKHPAFDLTSVAPSVEKKVQNDVKVPVKSRKVAIIKKHTLQPTKIATIKPSISKATKPSKHKAIAVKATKPHVAKKVAEKKPSQFKVKPFVPSKQPKQSVAVKGSHHLKLGVAEDYSSYMQSSGQTVKAKPAAQAKKLQQPLAATATHPTPRGKKNVHLVNAKQRKGHVQQHLASKTN